MVRSEDLVTPRVVLVLGMICIPAAGPLSWSMPQVFDPFWPRAVIAALSAWGLWVGARSAWGQRHLNTIAFSVNALTFAWFQYAASRNQQTVDDVMGLLVISIALATLSVSRRQLAVTAGVYTLGFLAIAMTVEPQFPTPITLLLFYSVYLGIGIGTVARRDLARQLAEANASLEERVDRRTRALHEHMIKLQDEVQVRQEAEARAEAANRAKTEFLATMSHELRTPLNAVLGYADLIREDLVDADMQETVQDVAQLTTSARRLLELIDQLLLLTQAEQGNTVAQLQPVQVAPAVQSTVETIQAESVHGNRFEVDVSPELEVVADPTWLERVLLNLVSNADKFTVEGHIRVWAIRLPHEVQVAVQDNGKGMPEGAAERIFERFTQLDGSRTRRQDGAGVGLTVCQELVEGMHGWIGVDSAVGRGSTFRIGLPRAHDASDAVAELA